LGIQTRRRGDGQKTEADGRGKEGGSGKDTHTGREGEIDRQTNRCRCFAGDAWCGNEHDLLASERGREREEGWGERRTPSPYSFAVK